MRNEHGLKATDRPVVKKLIWSFDTENDPDKGTLQQISATDTKSFFHFETREDFIEWLFLNFQRQQVFFSSCNLEYDLINVFSGYWHLVDLRLKNGGLSIVSARLRKSRVVFYDTLNHFPYGVATMGEKLGLPKLPMNLDAWDYCDRDAEIVARYCREMQEGYNALGANFNATVPSSSMDLYRRHFLPFAVDRLSPKIVEKLFEGYYGGRVEIFNVSPTEGNFVYIDVNSMYPAVMMEAYPNPNVYEYGQKASLDKFGMTCATVRVSDQRFPLLPHRLKAGDSIKLVFPVGEFKGVWTNEELRLAKDLGYKIVKVHWSITFPDPCYPFREFVTKLYDIKSKATDEISKYVAKLFLNSLYGKMAEKVDVVTLVPVDDVPPEKAAIAYGDFAFVHHGTKYAPHCNVIWSAYTTARARIKLTLEMMEIERKLGEVFYCDTDSIVYRARETLHSDSSDLGGWKIEKKLRFVHFVLPKLYAYRDEKGKFGIRAKGVPKCMDRSHSKPCHCLQTQFYTKRQVTFQRPHRLRATLKKHLIGSVWFTTSRSVKTTYNKRRVLAHGRTRAIIVRPSTAPA